MSYKENIHTTTPRHLLSLHGFTKTLHFRPVILAKSLLLVPRFTLEK